MKFQFDFSLREQDYMDFNYFHMFCSKVGVKQYKRLRLLSSGLFLAAGLLYLWQYGLNSDGIIYLFVFGVFAVISWFTCKPILRGTLKRQIKFNKKQGKLPYSPEVSMTFEEDCFTERTETNKSEYSYKVICDAYLVNDRMFYLYMDTMRAFLLPVNSFESKAQLDAFVRMLGEKAVSLVTCDFERSPYMEPLFAEKSE